MRTDMRADAEKVPGSTGTPALRLSGLRKSFGRTKDSVVAVDNLDLEIGADELVVLLGPSGCGKTTTLRSVAGLEGPDTGTIEISGKVAFDAGSKRDMSPEQRELGMVFQNYALWPHLTVRKNIEYPLRARGLKDGLSGGWVEQAAATVECVELLDRYPSELSGGQQQRVALARGLVARPRVMLFDEPLSNLDARLRSELRTEIRSLHERVGFAGLYVTHDQEEAMVVGDRIVVMRAGAIEQDGSPREVYRKPATEWVAQFFGVSNSADVGPGADGNWRVGGTAVSGVVPQWPKAATRLRIRPEDVLIGRTAEAVGGCAEVGNGRVERSTFSGRSIEYEVSFGEARWTSRMECPASVADELGVGDQCSVGLRTGAALLYDSDGALTG